MRCMQRVLGAVDDTRVMRAEDNWHAFSHPRTLGSLGLWFKP